MNSWGWKFWEAVCPAWASLMLACWLGGGLMAQAGQSGGFDYEVNSDGQSATIVGYHGSGPGCDFPASIEGLKVTGIGLLKFTNPSTIFQATLPHSVSFIADRAFQDCLQLKSLYFLGDAPKLGDWHYLGCSRNTFLYYIPGMAGWPSSGFWGYRTAVWYGNSPCQVKAVNRTLVVVGYQGTNADLVVPESLYGLPVVAIGNQALFGVPQLRQITLPDSITALEKSAFENCVNLESVAIGSKTLAVGENVFRGCTSLQRIEVSAANPVFASVEGVLLDKTLTHLLWHPAQKPGADYTLPGSVTHIAYGAFANGTLLTNLTLPNGLDAIGPLAFAGCAQLASLVLPNSVREIGSDAFQGCSQLTRVYFEGNAPSLGADALATGGPLTVYYVAGMTGWGTTYGNQPTATWPAALPFTFTTENGAVTLEKYTGNQKVVTLPVTFNGQPVTAIGPAAFAGASNLVRMEWPATINAIGDQAFAGCGSLASLDLPAQTVTLGERAFADCTRLAKIHLNSVLTHVGAQAFAGCRALTRVILPPGLASLGNQVFDHCDHLTSVTLLGYNAPQLGAEVFAQCPNLAAIHFQCLPPTVTNALFDSPSQAVVYHYPGAFGWGDTWAERPVALWWPRLEVASPRADGLPGPVGFNVFWAEQARVIVDYCTNLTQGTWTSVSTNFISDGFFYFTDPTGTAKPQGFFRLRLP